jgi:hypothetical protein
MKSYIEIAYNKDNGYYWVVDYSHHSLVWRVYSPSQDLEEAWNNYKKLGKVTLRDKRFDGYTEFCDITGAKDFKDIQIKMLVKKLCK